MAVEVHPSVGPKNISSRINDKTSGSDFVLDLIEVFPWEHDADVAETPSVVQRLYSLPLLNSAVGELVRVYKRGKESKPFLCSLGNAAEQGVVRVTTIASSGIQPIAKILHPQIKFIDGLARQGLDFVEAKVPIMHQHVNKVLSATKKNLSITLQSAQTHMGIFLDWIKSQLGVGMKRSKQVVLAATEAVLNSRIGQAVLSSANSMLSQAEQYMERSLLHDEPEGEGHEVVSVPSSSSVAFYPRLVAVSSKAGWEVYKKSAVMIQHVARSGHVHLTSARKALDAAFHFVLQKTSNRVVDVTHQGELDSDQSSDQVDTTTNVEAELQAK